MSMLAAHGHTASSAIASTLLESVRMYPDAPLTQHQAGVLKRVHPQFYASCLETIDSWDEGQWAEYTARLNKHIKGDVVGFVPTPTPTPTRPASTPAAALPS